MKNESYETLFETAIQETREKQTNLNEDIVTGAIVAASLLSTAAVVAPLTFILGNIGNNIDINYAIKKTSNSYFGDYKSDDGKLQTTQSITLKKMYDTVKKYGTSGERKLMKKTILKLKGHSWRNKELTNNIISEAFNIFKETSKRLGINITRVEGPKNNTVPSIHRFKNILNKKVDAINNNLKEYKDAKIGEKFGVDNNLEVFEFEKINPRELNSQETNSTKILCKELDHNFNDLKSYKVVGIWNGGEIIILGTEKTIAYGVDFEMGDIYSL